MCTTFIKLTFTLLFKTLKTQFRKHLFTYFLSNFLKTDPSFPQKQFEGFFPSFYEKTAFYYSFFMSYHFQNKMRHNTLHIFLYSPFSLSPFATLQTVSKNPVVLSLSSPPSQNHHFTHKKE